MKAEKITGCISSALGILAGGYLGISQFLIVFLPVKLPQKTQELI